MPKVKVESQTSRTPEETFQKIKTLLENDHELRKLDSGYVCKFDEQKLTGSAKGSKFTADMKVVSQGPGSNVEIVVDLPLMLTPVKGIVQSTLQKKIESALA